MADGIGSPFDAASAVLTAGVLGLAALMLANPQPAPPDVHPAPPRMEIALAVVQPVPPPPPPPQARPAATPPPVEAVAPPEVHTASPVPVPKPPRHHVTKAAAHMIEDTPPQTVPVRQDTAKAPAPPQQSRQDPSADALYTSMVHATIERHKRNPDSAAYRMMRPSGVVTLTFVLSRAGSASDIQVSRSAGSAMLDQQAVLIVADGGFPPMPTAAFAGAQTHLFRVEITFPPFRGAD
jgi:protein TonB